MDHGGQLEREAREMSQALVGRVDLCDNLPSPEALTAQTRNLNEANTLTQTQSLSPSQNEDRGGRGLIQKASLSNSGKDTEEEQEKEGYMAGGREEDEEEDTDEMMKDEEEEEGSEGSSCLIRCQSPDTPMTDSSYSETGSLLETPYPFSPGTSPEPTSPVIPVVSPETAYPTSQVELSQSDVKVDLYNSNTESVASGSIALGPTFTTGPTDSTKLTMTSDTNPPGPTCIIQATNTIAKNTNFTTEHLSSSTEPLFNHGLACARGVGSSYAGPTSTVETLTVTATATSTESNSTIGPVTLNWEHITSTPALLESLKQLAQRGDDTYLPQYLHQIAEAFVLHEDYQRALWCIQLERLYHQRLLDNLNALQEQWESRCRRTSPQLATQHLDTLKHICQTHSRPRARDAVCASMDVLRPPFEEGGAQPPCTSARQVDRGMEHKERGEDSSCSQSGHPVIPSIKLVDGLNSPEISEKDREDPDRELEGRDSFHESQLTDKQGRDGEGGEAEGGVGYATSIMGNELHPSTAGEMDQSKPAEQQGGDLGLAQEKEVKREEEERDVEEAADALEMEDEGEDEEEEKQKVRDSPFCQKALPVETLVSGAEVEEQQLHQEASAGEELHEETQDNAKTCLHQEACLPQEAHLKQQEQGEEEEEEEEEYEYELEQADIIREAASLDDMAKLITVEEMSPASGLVSILKKRSVCVDNMSVSGSSEPRPNKLPAKRRVRFRVPDDGYEQDVGGGDSCLLLFLLCLVTVVISVGGTALYCALGDAHSSVCQDFSRNADFYIGQIQRGISHIQHWFTPGS
ncbi:consortin isoform X1 [Dicentrarchus labrax]|uniref:Consortin n=1 Tax=Dicentrarchus labrax TaxID=13489 RepID=A0A8C4GFZ2_DICLA|nr:consortin isoform X1 [Dicentrarchus labrax]XP_051235148.1 consortin isoform X1 [Dicentrarchus labrax]XP_051235149.1 consortin isoform X1 [Dicentrarchus labrax]XP_051235150.1 consortin isoform X1 [Dicentrarchus labrax]